MEKTEVQKELERFRDYVIQQSRSNLTRQKKKASSKLYQSLNGKLQVNPNSFTLEFMMEDYGVYQDAGVKGADPSKVSPNAKIKGQQAPNSPYKFGSGTHAGTWGKFTASLEKWAKQKNIRLRDENGKFKKGNYKTISHIIARNIYARGLKPSLFFTKPFEAGYKRLPQELVEKYGLDMIKLFNEQTDKILKNG